MNHNAPDLVSDANGKINLGQLTLGTYYLVETHAPAGYNLLSAPVIINVTGSGVTYNQNNSTLSTSGAGIIHANAEDPYTLTVTNSSGYELPKTGDLGIERNIGIGAALITVTVSGWLLTLKRRSRRRES